MTEMEEQDKKGCICFADVSEVCVDADNKLVTTPAFMYNGAFHEIHDGVVKMVEKVIELIQVVESIE